MNADTRTMRSWVRIRRRLIIPLVALCLLLMLFMGRALWLPQLGRFLVVADPLRSADAVVALAGGEQRAPYAAGLFNAGYADWFVGTDTPLRVPGVRESYGELVRQEALWQGVPEARILIAPGVAESTYQEALAVRGLAQDRGWRALIVVTDPFHTRRARRIFRDVLRGTGINVIVRPVNAHWYQPDAWWRDRDGLRETWTEYLKLTLYLLGYR